MKKIISLLLFSVYLTIFSAERKERGVKRVFSLSQEENIVEKERQPAKKKRRITGKPVSSFFEELQKLLPEKFGPILGFTEITKQFYIKDYEHFSTKRPFSPTQRYHKRITEWFTNPENAFEHFRRSPLIDRLSPTERESFQILQLTHDFPYAFDAFLSFANEAMTDSGITNLLMPGVINIYKNNDLGDAKLETSIRGIYTWAQDSRTQITYHRSMKTLQIFKPSVSLVPRAIISKESGENLRVLQNASKYHNSTSTEERNTLLHVGIHPGDGSIAFESEAAVYGIKMKYPNVLFILYKNPRYRFRPISPE